ncbi:MAG: magnesium transporter [Bacilli bacterium]|nr:magnesium transporter [Bacilli bacterium]
MEEEIETLQTTLIKLVKKKDKATLKELLATTPVIDVAEALDDFEDKKITLSVIRCAGSELGADIFAELNTDTQQSIISAFKDKEIVALLDESFADDIVDSLDEFPASIVDRVLKLAPKELRKDINFLLNYKENTAGSVMTTEYLVLRENLTAKEALEKIRSEGKKAETIYTVFVKDAKRNLIGTLNLDDLVFSKDTETVEEIMNRDFVTCHATDDQEIVANDFKRYDLNAMAVLNKDNKLVGVITIDDIVDVIVDEANEDIAKLNKVSNMETPYLETPIYKIILKCVPWIIVLMILQVFSTLILSSFEGEIAKLAILSIFTPLIMDAGGNSGGQTTTIIVRSLALGEFNKGDMKRAVWKEFRVASCIAAIVAVFSFGWLMFELGVGIVQINDPRLIGWDKRTLICLLVASTLFITILISRMIGVLLPFFARLIKKDPAVMCGPLTTTLVDIISLTTYFLLWVGIFRGLIL